MNFLSLYHIQDVINYLMRELIAIYAQKHQKIRLESAIHIAFKKKAIMNAIS